MSPDVPEWSRVERVLSAFLRSRGLAKADAEEVLQEALLRILNGLERLRAPEAFDAFVFRTTRFALADHFRRAPRDQPGPDPVPEVADPRTVDNDEDATATRAQATLAAWLRAEIERLPEPTRSTLRRTELQGWTHRAVAEADQVGLSAIKSRVSRGRQELKRRLHRCCAIQLDSRQRVTAISARATETCDCRPARNPSS